MTRRGTRVLGPVGAVVSGSVFTLMLVLVVSGWPPLQRLDASVIVSANRAVADRGAVVSALHFVTDLGGSHTAWLLLTTTVVWLSIRRLPRLAVYVAITGLGAGVLSNGIKALVDRARPTVDVVVATAPDASFPSGHTLGSTVTYGVLLLVFLPVVSSRHRRKATATAVILVMMIGFTRIALGVHFPSDVVGGWALGVFWLAVTAVGFRGWRAHEGLRRPPLVQGLEPEHRPELIPARRESAVFPNGWMSAAQLIVGAVITASLLTALGWLITDVIPVRPIDVAIVEWFTTMRSSGYTTAAIAIGWLGGTAGIVSALVIATSITLAVTRSWAPPMFLVVAVAGETAIFLTAATLVERTRPPVEHLSPRLPPTSSFPSGHVAAATALYVGVALLLWASSRGWIRHLATSIAMVVPAGVALSRLYRGVHFPTDVLASVLYTSLWLAVCWWVLQPVRDSNPWPADHPDGASSTGGSP